MSKEKFTSKKFLSRCRRCPDLAYECTIEEIFEGTKQFLQYVGYEILPIPPQKGVKPEFYARRLNFEVMGILRYNLKEIPESITQLQRFKDIWGDRNDYIVVIPPVHEFWLHEFFVSTEGLKILPKIMEEGFLLWICKPKEKTVLSLVNAPQDKQFNSFFGAYSNVDFSGIRDRFDFPFVVNSNRKRRQLKKEQDEFLDILYRPKLEDSNG